MKLLNTSIFPYPYIKLIVNNYFTSFHIVCEKPHDSGAIAVFCKSSTWWIHSTERVLYSNPVLVYPLYIVKLCSSWFSPASGFPGKINAYCLLCFPTVYFSAFLLLWIDDPFLDTIVFWHTCYIRCMTFMLLIWVSMYRIYLVLDIKGYRFKPHKCHLI